MLDLLCQAPDFSPKQKVGSDSRLLTQHMCGYTVLRPRVSLVGNAPHTVTLFVVPTIIPCIPLKADSHIPCHSPAMPFCYGFREWLSHLIYTVWPCLIHTYHAVPLPCHKYAFLKATSQGHGRVTEWEQCGNSMLATCLPAFGVFLLPCGVPRRLSSEACQSQMQVVSVKESNVCHG
jgi:hypothetical protein